jgi:hypothetical protein
MATIKQTSNALGNLINQINAGIPPTTASSTSFSGSSGYSTSTSNINIDDDSIPTNMLNPEPVFEINYKSTQKQCVKKAKQQLQIIVKEVVPSLLQNSAMIVDKINQDAEQLGQLYYQAVCSDKVLQALMETIARGETQARLFEVYSKLSAQQESLASKITETQNQMRKYFIDTYLDLQQKDDQDDMLSAGKVTAAIEAPQDDVSFKGNTIVGTENTIKLIAERKKKAMIAKYQEIKD